MFAKISLIVLVLVILCPMGCFTFSAKHDVCHLSGPANDLKQFSSEFEYYEFNIPRAAEHPEQKDRNILKQMWRDVKATHRDIDYYLFDLHCDDDYDHLPDP